MMSAPPPPQIAHHIPVGPGGASVVSNMMQEQVHNAASQNLMYNMQNDGLKSDVQVAHNNHQQYLSNENEPKHSGVEEEVENEETSDAGSTEEIHSDYSADPVKLFVGQVPRSMEEADLFPVFEKYGPMEDVAIIRDKHTGQHRGCAFVTFFSKESADACEDELHNKFVFPGGKRAVQIRPAGRKEEIENKVFVGMLPRNVEEETVRELFEPYGDIKGIFLIRSSDGIKKGCAFVKYSQRESALAAIQSLHGAIALSGSDRPLIVKIADTKNQKKHRQTNHHHGMFTGHEPPVSHSSQGSYNGNMYYMPPGPTSHVHHLYPGHVPSHVTPTLVSSNTASPAGSYSSGHGQFPPSYHNTLGTGSAPPPNYVYQQLHYDAASHFTDHSRAPHLHQHQQHQATQRPREGPAGANLFIYHLPHDLTDADLATAFNPFGNVISAKVYVDRFTGESKGFGFVSYDSIISAEHAIEQMNGFQIGNKRLKVQHKRVNHRPPVSVPAMHHPYFTHGHSGPMHQIPVHDVPPAIEISGPTVGADNVYSSGQGQVTHELQQAHQQYVPHHDVDVLTANFESLNTEQGEGDNHQQH
jgi:CUG-BP- and ETR3-like factor